MIGIGDRAPDFTLRDAEGRQTTLSEALERGPAVVYFYPHDFTPVCTAQACMVRDRHAELLDAGYTVLGISAQSESSHGRFARRHALPFPVLADTGKHVARAYGVAGPLGLFPRRVTFLIGADGLVKDRVVSDFRVGPHRAFVDGLADQPAPDGAA